MSGENYSWVFDDLYRPQAAVDFDYVRIPKQEEVVAMQTGVDVKVVQDTINVRAFEVTSPDKADVNLRLFWFPGWTVTVAGKPVPFQVSSTDGTILVPVPAGSSTVIARFLDTPVRRLGVQISAFGMVLLISLSAGFYFWQRRNHSSKA